MLTSSVRTKGSPGLRTGFISLTLSEGGNRASDLDPLCPMSVEQFPIFLPCRCESPKSLELLDILHRLGAHEEITQVGRCKAKSESGQPVHGSGRI